MTIPIIFLMAPETEKMFFNQERKRNRKTAQKQVMQLDFTR